ncbi:UNVERIFIED_CONTAM: hypothetical protein FKN15_016839, partial [Acipenser sinensis]
ATSPEDVLKRYQMVLHTFKSEGSMQKALKRVKVDRDTLALTTPSAEIMIAAPHFMSEIGSFKPLQEKTL